jgi:hypothetical protein
MAIIACLVISGCGDTPRLGSNLARLARLATVGLPGVRIDRDRVEKIPYASIAAKLGGGPRSLLVLWRRDGNDLHWASADNSIIVTRHGRLVKTAGFPKNNLRETFIVGTDPLADARLSHGLVPFTRAVDFERDRMFGVQIDAELAMLRSEEIVIAGVTLESVLVVERCRARQLNWAFENRFWLDPGDGFVWKSRQHIARELPPLDIEVLKPAIG